MSTKTTKPRDPGPNRRWLLVDAADKPLGRLAVSIANTLRGKNRPDFDPSVDTGDFVIVVNAEKVVLTGRKDETKVYQRYSGWRGGLKQIPAATMRERHPDRMIMEAVRGMMPRNFLCRNALTRLKVYRGAEHPHAAQKPEAMNV